MNKNIGDILITFQVSEETLPTRSSSPWEDAGLFGTAQVWTTQTDDDWRGFPLQTYDDEGWHVWASGEFYGGPPELTRALKDLTELNGHFLIIAYEKLNQRWHVMTNRLGTVHAYLADDGKHVALGTFSPAVASVASTKKLDWLSIGGFFKFGFFLGDTTYYKQLRIINPATHLILNREGKVVSEFTYWNWDYKPDESLTFDEAIDNFGEIFELVTKEQVQNKSVALPISGGLDSRCTVAALCSHDYFHNYTLYPFSYGYSDDSIETRIAREVAHRRKCVIKVWSIKPYLFDKLSRVISCVEGFQDVTISRQAFVIDEISINASHVMAAHWGDVWLNDMGYLDHPIVLPDNEIAVTILRKYSKNSSRMLIDLFKDYIPSNVNDIFESYIANELKTLSSIKDFDFKVKAWKTKQWSFRWTLASLRMYQAGLTPLLPFYDNRMVDYFMKIPGDFVKKRKLQIEYLKRFAPDLASVRWQPFNANLFEYQYFNIWLIPRRLVTKLKRKLSRQQIVELNWQVQFLNPIGRKNLESYLLQKNLKLHKYVSPNLLASTITDFYHSPNGELSYTLAMLLTLSTWLEKFG